jgi:NitT/TauT family transport system ATP-binding protein
MVTHSIAEAVYLSDRVLVFTERPARISFDLKNPLPRPRQSEMRYSAEFTNLAKLLHDQLALA